MYRNQPRLINEDKYINIMTSFSCSPHPDKYPTVQAFNSSQCGSILIQCFSLYTNL